MSSITIDQLSRPSVRPVRQGLSSWELWGRILVVPYLLIFVVFVIYPVGYGLWLARHPVRDDRATGQDQPVGESDRNLLHMV